ncbi:MAG: hypothetical protein ACRD2A_13655 [Vicinamibacterales bacterium]
MKKSIFLMALAVAVLIVCQTANAQSSRCCAKIDVDEDPGTPPQGCKLDAPGVPDGSGCTEVGGNCIGGAAPSGSNLARGCVCVGAACVSGTIGPDPGGILPPDFTVVGCKKNAALACCGPDAPEGACE